MFLCRGGLTKVSSTLSPVLYGTSYNCSDSLMLTVGMSPFEQSLKQRSLYNKIENVPRL